MSKTAPRFQSFSKLAPEPRPVLSVCSYGHEKRGKTYWALSAPGPVAVISSDAGTEATVRVWERAGKDVLLFRHIVPPTGQNIDTYERAWDKVAQAMYEAMESSYFRTVVVDTATEMWELLRLARFGRLTQVMPHHYGPVNAEFRSLINKAVNCGKNTVWIHKVKKVYKTNKNGVDSWSGEWERAGFTDFGYIIDLVVENDISEGEFVVRVVDSRYRTAQVNGQEFRGVMGLFPALAMELRPETSWEDWSDGVEPPE